MNTIETSFNPYLVHRTSGNASSPVSGAQEKQTLEIVDRPENQCKTNKSQDSPMRVLSQKEIATLSMLFGSSKPDELKLYGHSQIQSIHKGHLLDVKG